jgi:hypothetical protein
VAMSAVAARGEAEAGTSRAGNSGGGRPYVPARRVARGFDGRRRGHAWFGNDRDESTHAVETTMGASSPSPQCPS